MKRRYSFKQKDCEFRLESFTFECHMNFIIVFIGGGFGSLLRYQLGLWIQKTNATLPWATFAANVSACLIFAVTLWLCNFKFVNQSTVKLLLLTGFCGGLSTFSSFGYETFLLLKQSMHFYALLNILLNTFTCLLIFYLIKQ